MLTVFLQMSACNLTMIPFILANTLEPVLERHSRFHREQFTIGPS